MEISLKLNCHVKWNVTKTVMALKQKCNLNWNGTETETEMSLKQKNTLTKIPLN